MKGGKNKNNKELVRVLVNNSSAIVDWLTERGADLSELTSTGGQSVKRTHRPTGGSAVGPNIVAALSKTAESEKIDIRKGKSGDFPFFNPYLERMRSATIMPLSNCTPIRLRIGTTE